MLMPSTGLSRSSRRLLTCIIARCSSTTVDSTIHSLADLRGKQFAFGDIDSTSANRTARLELKQAGIDPEIDLELRYSRSHLATAAMVQTGLVDTAAVGEAFFNFVIMSGTLDGKKSGFSTLLNRP